MSALQLLGSLVCWLEMIHTKSFGWTLYLISNGNKAKKTKNISIFSILTIFATLQCIVLHLLTSSACAPTRVIYGKDSSPLPYSSHPQATLHLVCRQQAQSICFLLYCPGLLSTNLPGVVLTNKSYNTPKQKWFYRDMDFSFGL